MFRFDLPNEVEAFNERNRQAVALLPHFSDTLYRVFNKSVQSDRKGLTVFMLGRLCAKDFSEILLLSSNGHGFAALQVLRSMFEKLVDASYLNSHLNEVDAFWNYHFVNLEKLGWEEIAEKYNVEWRQIAASFKTRTKKGKRRTQSRWSPHSLVTMANEVGLGDQLQSAYYLPNLFVHNSPAEILFSLETEANGKLSPVDRGGTEEKRFADIAFFQGYLLVLKTMALVIEHYGWDEDEQVVQDCADALEKCIRSAHKQTP
jgi:hypothetical protein